MQNAERELARHARNRILHSPFFLLHFPHARWGEAPDEPAVGSEQTARADARPTSSGSCDECLSRPEPRTPRGPRLLPNRPLALNRRLARTLAPPPPAREMSSSPAPNPGLLPSLGR